MPKITLLFASLHVVLMLILTVRVILHRRAQQIGIGDGGDKWLTRKIRVHANFIENVPMALLELAGFDQSWLWALGGTLLFARILHAAGFSRHSGYSFGRFWGTVLTWGVLMVMAAAGLWLGLSMR